LRTKKYSYSLPSNPEPLKQTVVASWPPRADTMRHIDHP
jgi:hypothetical protein